MITEDYCSYEVAKLLKDKGFDEICTLAYEELNQLKVMMNWRVASGYLPCPTHQMAMKWLREMYNIFIIVEPHMYDYVNKRNASYVFSIWVGDNYYENPTSTDYPTFEEAVDAILKYSLVKLI